jgi:tetratricopeptide (TPR) repeat protein
MSKPKDRRVISLLERGCAAHRRGELAAARVAYDAALRLQPLHPEALYLAATCALQQQDWPGAAAALRRYLSQHPADAAAHSMCAVALQFLGELSAALGHMQEAVRLEPQAAEHHYNLGKLMRRAGKLQEAESAYAEALRLKPDYAQSHNNRSEILLALGRPQEARAAALAALALAPALPEALNTLAAASAALGKFDEALAAYDQALAARPGSVPALLGRGLALDALGRRSESRAALEQALSVGVETLGDSEQTAAALRLLGRRDEALRCIERLLASDARQPQIHNLLGLVLADLHRPREALQAYSRSLELRPDFAEALINRGNAFLMLNELENAGADFDAALALAPQQAQANWNRCLCDLLAGHYEQGWRRYHWRWSVPAPISRPPLRGPSWNGRDPVNDLLIWEEQGLGDQVLFCSLIHEVAACAQRLILAPSTKLLPLLARSFPQAMVMPLTEAVANFADAAQIPFGDLGLHRRSSGASFPEKPIAFLQSDHARRDNLRKALARPGQLICGLSWRSINTTIGREKSMELPDLAPLFELEHVFPVNLQYGATSDEISRLKIQTGHDLACAPDIDLWNDIDGVAALVDACDIVVTTSNTTAHIAGGLGKVVYLMLPYSLGRSWYWAERKGRSIWYPEVRVFRQSSDGDWTGVLAAVREALAALPPPAT